MRTVQRKDKMRSSPEVSARFLTLVLTLATLAPVVNAGWIDIETPLDRRTTTSLVDGTVYHLVMSDEFNTENRTFKDGHDPLWTALDKSDDDASSAGGGSLQFYNSSAVTTKDGFLHINTFLEKTKWNQYDHVNKEWKSHTTNFTSGMVQSWNKFCFTGGIVEVDIILPGAPHIGGLWPAVWMLGNLGRATYEASTNMIWPWSYDTCDRELQQAQAISACNKENHFGMNPNQGRGATEIDIIEVMTGDSNGPLPATDPPIALPYCDLTLQLAPGILKNRPQNGALPLRKSVLSTNGETAFSANTWYEDLEMHGNTSINPFFYGNYLGETKPKEPVSRTKKQAFQADAVGAAHQLTPAHFSIPHTIRLEWQTGPGGRVDWFMKGHKINSTLTMEGDGKGHDWTHALGVKDKSLKDLMGSQIPIEPSALIMNVAISSTWGFPYAVPEYCTKCFDCDDPKCQCAFNPGFCKMIESGKTAMMIDSIRVYQSHNASSHVGANHTLGCDPPGYPTKEWIAGHEYRYARAPPFGISDKGHSLKRLQRGGGSCKKDRDCGAHIQTENLTAVYEEMVATGRRTESTGASPSQGRGSCGLGMKHGMFSTKSTGRVCSCEKGFTGPHCLAQDFFDESPSASKIRALESPFHRIANFQVPYFMLTVVITMITILLSFLVARVFEEKKARIPKIETTKLERPATAISEGHGNYSIITGRSI